MSGLTKECPHCEEGIIWRSRYGGNDPDTRPVGCEQCDGEGNMPIYCEGWHKDGDHEAVEIVDGMPACAVHAAEWKAEAST
jgi:hypothetical protein